MTWSAEIEEPPVVQSRDLSGGLKNWPRPLQGFGTRMWSKEFLGKRLNPCSAGVFLKGSPSTAGSVASLGRFSWVSVFLLAFVLMCMPVCFFPRMFLFFFIIF